MAKKALLALTLAVILAPRPASATSPGLEQAVQDFMAVHGPQAMVAVDRDGRGAWLAGLFASTPLPVEPGLAALAFLESWKELWGFDPGEHLVVGEVSRISTLTYVRLDQVHEGVVVEASGAKVTLDPEGRVRHVAVRFGWSAGFADSTPSLTLEQATEILDAAMTGLRGTGQSRLAYLPGGDVEAPLVWVLGSRSTTGPEAPEVSIDAHTGEVLLVRDTNVYADGNVYDPNPSADPTVYRRELLNLTSTSDLTGTYGRAFSCIRGSGWDICPGSTRTRHASPDGDGHYLFSPDEPSLTDPFAEVMAYYHMNRINTWMEDTYGHSYTCAGHRWMDAHVNMDYENAWYGDQNEDGCPDVTIGQGAYDFSYDSAILYHEFGHGINHTYTELRWAFDGLGPDNSPQGVDEAFADYWAATLIGRPTIGEYAASGTISELGMRDVSIFASCPDNIFGEGHYDSPMLSSCLWDIRTAIGQDKTDRLALATLDAFSARPDFDEAGRTLLSQASALQGSGVLTASDVSAVDTAVANHTLVGCERIVVLEDGDRHTFLASGAWGGDAASGVQFMLYAPPGATRVTAVLDAYTSGSGSYSVYVNRDAPVHFSRSGWSYSIDDYDFRFDGSPDRVSFTEWSDHVVEGDTEYYYTYVHDTDFMLLNVEAIIVWSTPPDATADVIDDPTPDPATDTATDVPGDGAGDPTADTTPGDADTDTQPDPGTITEDKGCGCSLAR